MIASLIRYDAVREGEVGRRERLVVQVPRQSGRVLAALSAAAARGSRRRRLGEVGHDPASDDGRLRASRLRRHRRLREDRAGLPLEALEAPQAPCVPWAKPSMREMPK